MLFVLYDILFPLLFLLYLPFYLVHIFRRGGLTAEYWQRFGFFGKDIRQRLASLDNKVWVHAVSVGESVAAVTFIRAWQKAHPEDNVVFSCGTSTAFETMRKKALPGVTIIYCPFDFHWAVRTALELVAPHTLVIFEVEIWPNLVLMAKRKGIKVCLVNGRMSDRSSAGYAKWPCIFKPIFNSFAALCVQTDEDADRIAKVTGTKERITVCGTMKFDQVPDANAADVTPVLDAVFGKGPRLTFVAGSTHPGEEELICNAVSNIRKSHPELKLVLVPRHCERANEVASTVRKLGLSCRLLKNDETTGEPAEVLLVNTTGELMNYYGAADVAYVGKSLAGQSGGHNIIEPAIFGKAIIHGSRMENFRAVAELFRNAHASVEVAYENDFEKELRHLVEDADERNALGKNARALVEKYRGSIDRTIQAING